VSNAAGRTHRAGPQGRFAGRAIRCCSSVAWPCQAPLLAPGLARPAKRQDVPFLPSQARTSSSAAGRTGWRSADHRRDPAPDVACTGYAEADSRRRSQAHQEAYFKLHHRRDRHNREVDLLVTHAGGLIAIEIKAASRVSIRDFRHLKWFASEGPGKGRRTTMIVLYLGHEKLSFGNRAFALPASALCGTALCDSDDTVHVA